MPRPVASGFTLLAAVALLSSATPALAQRAPAGVGLAAAALLPSERLGAGDLSGWGLQGQVGLTSRVALEGAWMFFGAGATETRGDLRSYRLTVPSMAVRTTLFGGPRHDLAILTGFAMQRYALDATAYGAEETKTVPSLGVGLALRLNVAGPVAIEISGRDWISRSRDQEFNQSPSFERAFAHSPEFRVALTALWRRKKPTITDPAATMPSFEADFQPVPAASVPRDPSATNGGRDHLHTDDGTSIGMKVVDAAELAGAKEPSGVSVLAPTGPVDLYTDEPAGAVFFGSGSYEVRPQYRTLLGDVARHLHRQPEAQLQLFAYADERGNTRINQSLAEQRGTAIQELLVRVYGVPQQRIAVTAVGADYRSTTHQSARRVELVVRTPTGHAGLPAH